MTENQLVRKNQQLKGMLMVVTDQFDGLLKSYPIDNLPKESHKIIRDARRTIIKAKKCLKS